MKAKSIVQIGIIYLIATALGFLVFKVSKNAMSELWALFLADVVATIIVWFFGLIHKNVSVYDPLLERGSTRDVHRLGFLQIGFHFADSLTAHHRVVLGHPFDGQLGLYL